MSARFKALLFGLLVVSACTPDSVAAPPPTASAAQVAALPGTMIPADRWRAVLIAGDNNSPAFDNGVAALSDKLRARGVRDVTALTSDPAANPKMPAATAANVSQALRGGGGEACLAFVTSHGDETGVVLRAANGMLAPQSFTNAITAGCGSRPTVVIVSACHSGVFMTNALRQPNRVVLTAAAADRVSFGCGASDEYTYFDQCLLQQFDGVATWQQLAVSTRTCVENLERSMGVRRPSQPQIFVGAQVADLRIPGR